MDHFHLHGPISRVGDGGVGFEDTGVGRINEVWMEAGASFGLDEAFTYWSHPESPHKLVAIKSLLSLDEANLFFFVSPEPIDVCY